ncbi:MAG: stage III sporulation protein AB [Lachnospiraceae bacterium]|nr:stage III sporulation protein AB [Lachnospiraceae bacterium]
MKIVLTAWILISCAGLAHSLVAEQSWRLSCMKDMTEGLLRVGFYISQWQLPMEEIFQTMGKEKTSVLADFYGQIAKELQSRRISDLGELWKEKSEGYLQGYGIPKQAADIWSECFLDRAALPAEELRRLTLRAEEIGKICGQMEEKYRQERRPILVLSVCAGAFFCLLMW